MTSPTSYARPVAAPGAEAPRCPTCSTSYPPGSRFCAADGHRLTQPTPGPAGGDLAELPSRQHLGGSRPSLGQWLVAGRYLKLRILGDGGQGKVRLVQDIQSGRVLALKEFYQGSDIARCRSEVEAAARIEDHSNIVKIYELHREPETEMPFITMEYIDGQTLEAHLQREELSLAEAISVLQQTSRGLVEMHEKQLVHRDIKPGNIMLRSTSDGFQVKLLDLGITKSLTPDLNSGTYPGSVLGTLDYAAPEQLRGEPVTPSFDMYALGVVAHRLFEGHLPSETKPPRDAPGPQIPHELRLLTARMLEEDPARRPQQMREVAHALERAERALVAGTNAGRPCEDGATEPHRWPVPVTAPAPRSALRSRRRAGATTARPRWATFPRTVGVTLSAAAALFSLFAATRHAGDSAPELAGHLDELVHKVADLDHCPSPDPDDAC